MERIQMFSGKFYNDVSRDLTVNLYEVTGQKFLKSFTLKSLNRRYKALRLIQINLQKIYFKNLCCCCYKSNHK